MRIAIAFATSVVLVGCGDKKDKAVPAAAAVGAQSDVAASTTDEPAQKTARSPALTREQRNRAQLAALAAGPPAGPSMTAKTEWQTCQKTDECTVVYSGCGTQKVHVNKKFKSDAKAAWKKTCDAHKGKPMGILAAMSGAVACTAGKCTAGSQFRGLSGELGTLSKDPLGSGGVVAPPRRRTVDVSLGMPTVTAGYAKEIVRRVLRRSQRRMERCFESAIAAEPKAGGDVSISFAIDAAGKTAKRKLTGGRSQRLRDCVARGITLMRFPKPADGTKPSVKVVVGFKRLPKPEQTKPAK